MLQQLRRRDLIVLMGVLTLLCVAAFGAGYAVYAVLQNQTDNGSTLPVAEAGQTEIQHTINNLDVTGLTQYPLAKEAAQGWANDIELIAAGSDWPTVLAVDQVGEPSSWGYRFYSPSKKQMLFVTVEPDGQVETIEHKPEITLPPRIVDTNNWLFDSPTALALWLDFGGADMLAANPGMELLAQLRVTGDTGGPAWLVTGVDQRTEEMLMVVVDAQKGVVTRSSLDLNH